MGFNEHHLLTWLGTELEVAENLLKASIIHWNERRIEFTSQKEDMCRVTPAIML